MLPKRVLERIETDGFELAKRGSRPSPIGEGPGWARTARVLAALDHDRFLVLQRAGSVGVLRGIVIDPDEPIAAALTVEAPADATPGERFRFDVIQRQRNRIAGAAAMSLP